MSLEYYNDPKAFIEYLNNMDEIFDEKFDDYSSNK